jgi:hypothetical protein
MIDELTELGEHIEVRTAALLFLAWTAFVAWLALRQWGSEEPRR